MLLIFYIELFVEPCLPFPMSITAIGSLCRRAIFSPEVDVVPSRDDTRHRYSIEMYTATRYSVRNGRGITLVNVSFRYG